MGIQIGEKKTSMSEPNIVPLIDILLVLLIIFMVITPTTPKGLDAQVPQPAPPNQKENPELLAKTVVVQVNADGSVKINQTTVTWDQLGSRLEDIFKQRAEKVAFIKGEDAVEFALVARAIDIMHSAGIDKVGLITAKIEAGQ
jgi:biopolymer transport protein TolR